MGFFSSIFKPSVGQQMGDVCFTVREKVGFLDDYASKGRETAASNMRLTFSKDVLMLLISASLIQVRIRNQAHTMQENEVMRDRYLGLIATPPTSMVGDCLVCEDELNAAAQFAAPRASLSELRTTRVSTKGFLSLVADHRAGKFREDWTAGAYESQRNPLALWNHVARTLLVQIRGVPHDAIPADDVFDLSIAISIPYTLIYEAAQRILP